MTAGEVSQTRKILRVTWRLALLLVVQGASCFHLYLNLDRAPEPLLSKRLEIFDIPPSIQSKDVPRQETISSLHIQATFPVQMELPGRREPLRVHLYKQESVEAPLVLVLPTLGGRYILSRTIADSLYDAGFSILRLERRGPLVEREGGMASAREAFRGSVIDVRRALNWIDSLESWTPVQVGLVGVSAGGIIGSLVSGIEERIDSIAVLLAGGNLAEMVSHSSEAGLARLKTAALRSRPLMRDSFDEVMGEFLASLDPLAYVGRLPRERILMVNAAFDSVIPRRCTLALWDAWGRPELLELPAGHYTAVLFLPIIMPYVIEHFKKTLFASK